MESRMTIQTLRAAQPKVAQKLFLWAYKKCDKCGRPILDKEDRCVGCRRIENTKFDLRMRAELAKRS